MKKALALFVLWMTSSIAVADTSNCENVYLGRVVVRNGHGLFGVVFLNNPGDSTESHWVLFDGWTADDKKAALALLVAAKIAQHRINVRTGEAGGCSIQTGQSVAVDLGLAGNP